MTFVAVDWGTTNRRAWLVADDGSVSGEMGDDQGILAVADFPASVAALRDRHGSAPLLMAGMIGSNRGWSEAPYVRAPAGLDELAAAIHRPADGVAIVPGVAYDTPTASDVMRGEEVQIVGALAAGTIAATSLVCHPGTHTKWIEVEAGRIARFRTVMTGDLLAALKANSILSDLLAEPPALDAAFVDGVDWALEHHELTAALFEVRARVLLGKLPPAHAPSRIAGLLVGADVRAGLGRTRHDLVPVLGSPRLTEQFAAGLARAGRQSVNLDGEPAFLAGMRAIAQRIGW